MARKSVKAEVGPIDASARLRMPYARLLVPEEEGGYRAEILEFPGCIAVGDDAAEALSELEAVAEDWIDAAVEMGSPIPPPLEETNYSGKLNLRLPKSLHRKASLAADLEGVSLNQLIVASLAEYLGQKATAPQVVFVGAGVPRGQIVVSGAPMWEKHATSSNATHLTIGGFELQGGAMQEFHYANR